MKFEEIPKRNRERYEAVCGGCLETLVVFTQGGRGEYETEVYILCKCGECVEFILPVN